MDFSMTATLGMELIQAVREHVHSFFNKCHIPYEVTPFDEGLYEECLNDGVARGYPMDGARSVRTHLRVGVVYAATAGGHLLHRPTQIWIALYTSCLGIVDDADSFPEEMPEFYHFSDRFIRGETQGNGVLDALADIIRRASDLYPPLASHLIITSSINFVTGMLLEHETRTMQILGAAQEYPTYQRTLTGAPDAYTFMAFPKEIPVNDYIQAVPELGLFLANVNDVLSFYKEERDGETTNRVSTLAARTCKSKLATLGDLTEATSGIYTRIMEILEGSPEACETFKVFVNGYVRFHTSSSRYRMRDLGLS